MAFRKVCILFLPFVLLALTSLGARAATDTLFCSGGAFDTLTVKMVTGEILDSGFSFVNMSTRDSVRIRSADNRLIIADSLPVASQDSLVHIAFRLILDTAGTYFLPVTLQPIGGGCSITRKVIRVFVRDPTIDSAALSLSHNVSTFIAMRSNADSSTVVVRLLNNTTDTIRIDNLSMDSGVHFRIVAVGTELPARVLPQGYLTATIAFIHSPLGVTRDSLIIVGNDPILTDGFVVIGYRGDSLAVRPTAHKQRLFAGHLFSAVPNPSEGGRIRLVGPRLQSGVVEMRDVLGNTVIASESVHGDVSSSWQLDASAYRLTKGAYFIRIAGATEYGDLVQETVRVVIE